MRFLKFAYKPFDLTVTVIFIIFLYFLVCRFPLELSFVFFEEWYP